MGDAGKAFDQVERIRGVHLRLVDAASELNDTDLVPVPSPEELLERLRHVATEVHAIEGELRLLIHITALENGPMLEEAVRLEQRLAHGWRPDAVDAEHLIERLNKQFA